MVEMIICPKHGKLRSKLETAKWDRGGSTGILHGQFCGKCRIYYSNSPILEAELKNHPDWKPTWRGYPLRYAQKQNQADELQKEKRELPSYVKVIPPEEQERYRIENEKHRAEMEKRKAEQNDRRKETRKIDHEKRLQILISSEAVKAFHLLYQYIETRFGKAEYSERWRNKEINRLRLEFSVQIRNAGYVLPKKYAQKLDLIINRYMDPANEQNIFGSMRTFDDAFWKLIGSPEEKQKTKNELGKQKERTKDISKRQSDSIDPTRIEISRGGKICREEIDLTRNQVDIFVNRGSLRCQREKHRIINVQAIVWARTNAVKIPIQKCMTCQPHFYFIGQEELCELERQYGVLMLQYADGPDQNDQMEKTGFAVESVIHRKGYTVSEQQGLTALARQKILTRAISGGRVSKADVMRHLENQIQLRKNDPRMARAIAKWREDLDFLAHRLDGSEIQNGNLTRNRT